MLLNPYRFGPSAPPGAGYRYWRLAVTKWKYAGSIKTSTASGGFAVGEFSLHTAAPAQYPTASMTSNSAPSPLVASASSELDSTSRAYLAFDGKLGITGDDTDTWYPSGSDPGPYWLQIDLGAPIEAVSCRITPPYFVNDSGPGSFALRSFSVLASTTGSFSGEEVEMLSVVDLASSGWDAETPRQFDF